MRRGAPDLTWLLDALACALLAGGGAYAALFALGQAQGFLLCCAFAAAHVLFLGLIARRWWVLPALLGGLGAAVGLTAWALGGEEVLLWLRGALAWVSGGLDPEAAVYGALRPLALCAATLPLTAALYVCLRAWFHVAIPALYALLLNVAANLLDLPQWQPVLLTSLGGLMLCLPRAAAAGRDRLPRRYGQTLALPLAALCLAGAYFFVPAQDGAWRVEPVRALFADVEDWYDYHFGSAAGGSAAGRSELQPLGGRLGGDLELSPELTLRVKAGEAALLRGNVQDTYDGARWYQGWRNGRFRFDSLLWRGRLHEVFLTRLPVGGREARALYGKMTREAEMEIAVQKPDTSLFAFGTPASVRIQNQKGVDAYFNLDGELFAGRRYGRGLTYTVRGTLLDRSLAGFGDNMHALLALTGGLEDPYEAAVRARYTHLPDTLPDWVAALALQIAEGSADEYEAMCRIETWLRENCVYSETPGAPPEGEDFVAHFLTTRTGYCTYYASAMAVMARACGLPSRYVTGYGLLRDGTGGRFYVARGVTAHAWAEIYFHGVGWVTFDPLAWSAEAASEAAEAAAQAALAAPSPTPPAPLPTPAPTAQPDAGQQAQPGAASALPVRALLLLGAAACAALALLLLVRWLDGRQTRRFALARLLGRLGRREAGLKLFADLERQLHLYNLDRAAGETLSAWAMRVDRSLPMPAEADAACLAAVRVAERMIYGEAAPYEEELAALARYHGEVERALRQSLGRAYLWKRAIR